MRELQLKMKLESDAIFGNGISVPGGEDISVVRDDQGFPYFKGGTMKGICREMYERFLEWEGTPNAEINQTIIDLFGASGDIRTDDEGKLIFSDFTICQSVKDKVLQEVELCNDPRAVLDAFSSQRTFTALQDGTVEAGSLRIARCINKGISLYSTITCYFDDEERIAELKEVISLIHWIGTMRNRGFGKVTISVTER